jgi:ankyrin repeat protein
MPTSSFLSLLARVLVAAAGLAARAHAQTPPSTHEIAAYAGLHAAAANGDAAEIARLAAAGANLNARDSHGRTPLMVAAHGRHVAAAKALIDAKADLNLLDAQAYDVITIAAVADDVSMLELALASGGNARAITSPYKGTALIAAAHLGHAKVVEALIEAIVLGDGGPRHQATIEALVKGGANLNLADGQGVRPLSLARSRGYRRVAEMLERAGAKP